MGTHAGFMTHDDCPVGLPWALLVGLFLSACSTSDPVEAAHQALADGRFAEAIAVMDLGMQRFGDDERMHQVRDRVIEASRRSKDPRVKSALDSLPYASGGADLGLRPTPALRRRRHTQAREQEPTRPPGVSPGGRVGLTDIAVAD